MTTDKVRRALISVSDKTGVVEFARALLDRGWMIISTGGTYDALKKAGLNVLKVKDFTGFEEILDGRVKTLHPKVHGGILARRKNAEHVATLQRSGIPEIDLVAVNLYPFRQTAVKTGVSFEDLVEQIDIGGPAMVRSAAKNAEDVLVVVDPEDYPGIILQLDLPDGPPQACRFELMRKAFLHTAAYDTMIAGTLSRVRFEGGLPVHEPLNLDGPVPDLLTTMMSRQMTLRYGENPHQQAGWYLPVGNSPTFAQLQGKELSYTNMLDLEAARRIVGIFPDSPAACVVKHTNPCGVGRASNITDAYVLARDADPLSAFGGIVGLNQPLDAATAREIVRTFIEGVIAPAVDPDALAVLAKKADLRVIADLSPVGETEMRPALGGVLVQEVDYVYEAWTHWGPHRDNLKVVTKRQPTEAEWDALRFAWRICAMVKSNAVILTLEDRTMGIGGGQPNRVGSAKIACGALTGDIVDWRGCVAASDAFFPFRDGLDVVARAGATAVVQPGGSKNDPEVIAAADEHGLAMVFTGRRHFRH